MNSIRNEFQLLVDQIKVNVDILMVSETEIDNGLRNGIDNRRFQFTK